MESKITTALDPSAPSALDVRIADLRRELTLLEAEQRSQEREQRARVLREVRSVLIQHGFKPAELVALRGKPASGRSGVAPLYRDPGSGATWSGRGTEPAWIKGRDRAAFKL